MACASSPQKATVCQLNIHPQNPLYYYDFLESLPTDPWEKDSIQQGSQNHEKCLQIFATLHFASDGE